MAIHGGNNAIPMIDWRIATLKKSEQAAIDVTSLVFDVPGIRHKAGQHYDIRLTAENGYQAERSYSAANPPEDEGRIEFGVQVLEGGEVSPYLSQLAPGEQVEVRGPIGGHFVWDISMPGPLMLIGGGSGMVPLMSMVRHHFRNLEGDKSRPVLLLVSARTLEHVLYHEELKRYEKKDPNFKLVITLTHEHPEGWTGYTRLIDAEMFTQVFGFRAPKLPGENSLRMYYICGPTPFVEAAARLLMSCGVDSHLIKTERFGGSDSLAAVEPSSAAANSSLRS